MSDPEIRHAMQLIGIEVERANILFPNDKSEAVFNCPHYVRFKRDPRGARKKSLA